MSDNEDPLIEMYHLHKTSLEQLERLARALGVEICTVRSTLERRVYFAMYRAPRQEQR